MVHQPVEAYLLGQQSVLRQQRMWGRDSSMLDHCSWNVHSLVYLSDACLLDFDDDDDRDVAAGDAAAGDAAVVADDNAVVVATELSEQQPKHGIVGDWMMASLCSPVSRTNDQTSWLHAVVDADGQMQDVCLALASYHDVVDAASGTADAGAVSWV